MGAQQCGCSPFEAKETDTDSTRKLLGESEKKSDLDESNPRALTLLDLWANKPGFYSEAYFARIMYKDYFDTQKPNKSDTSAKQIVLNWAKVTAYIAGADKLREEERDLLIKSEQIWSGYTASPKEIESAIAAGLNMTGDEAAQFANTLATDHGTEKKKSCVPLLYYALTISGVDGLSNEEKEKFTEIAKSMGIEQDDINEIIETYLLEVKFGKKLHRLLGEAEKN